MNVYRSYYRCSYKSEQDCAAMKQVQRIQEDLHYTELHIMAIIIAKPLYQLQMSHYWNLTILHQ
jgi:hypothetical protein